MNFKMQSPWNVQDKTPAAYKDRMHAILDLILDARGSKQARTAPGQAYDELKENAARALHTLEDGVDDATAILALPGKYRRRLPTTNMVERFIEELRRREKVVRIFPNVESAFRLIGALCAEQHEEWAHPMAGDTLRWTRTSSGKHTLNPQARTQNRTNRCLKLPERST